MDDVPRIMFSILRSTWMGKMVSDVVYLYGIAKCTAASSAWLYLSKFKLSDTTTHITTHMHANTRAPHMHAQHHTHMHMHAHAPAHAPAHLTLLLL